ncbi:hypothetical protein XA68_18350 [Ophiocordyceps unilateralis]|uniref:Uncharacterized protein n=1 Tax=Ophiocordyceps unilateralis TaxID=268505 RepID=A0A2A9P1I6_OPHUN|nr:hypothetical protein XA68_18350 [Ophiocordyceps unilateralis]
MVSTTQYLADALNRVERLAEVITLLEPSRASTLASPASVTAKPLIHLYPSTPYVCVCVLRTPCQISPCALV